MRRIIYLGMVSLIVFGVNSLSWASMCGGKMHLAQAKAGETTSQEKLEVGNIICPVSGEEMEKANAIKFEHEGKIYNLCCKACAKDFKKAPKKYIEKLEEEKGHKGHHHGGHEGHHE